MTSDAEAFGLVGHLLVGIILSVFFYFSGNTPFSLSATGIQVLITLSVCCCESLKFAAISMFWHSFVLAGWTSLASVTFYDTYKLIEYNTTELITDRLEQPPFINAYTIIFALLCIIMMIRLHQIMTERIVATSDEYLENEVLASAVFFKIISIGFVIMFSFVAYKTTVVWRAGFVCLTIFELIMTIAYVKVGKVLQVPHCFYQILGLSAIFFVIVAKNVEKLHFNELNVMLQSPWWQDVNQLLGMFSVTGAAFLLFFWYARLIAGYVFMMLSGASRRMHKEDDEMGICF